MGRCSIYDERYCCYIRNDWYICIGALLRLLWTVIFRNRYFERKNCFGIPYKIPSKKLLWKGAFIVTLNMTRVQGRDGSDINKSLINQSINQTLYILVTDLIYYAVHRKRRPGKSELLVLFLWNISTVLLLVPVGLTGLLLQVFFHERELYLQHWVFIIIIVVVVVFRIIITIPVTDHRC